MPAESWGIQRFALWLAARKRIPKSSELFSSNPLPIAGVVDLDGPGDLQATLPLQQPVCGSPVVTDIDPASEMWPTVLKSVKSLLSMK